MRQLSGAEWALLAADTPSAQNLIAPIAICDPSDAPGGQITYEDALRFVRTRLQVSSNLRERLLKVPLDLDRPYWIRDADFDLEYHVRHLALPEPGDWHQLRTQIARLGSRPLDLTRPPWELYIIDGLDEIPGIPEGSFAALLKMHHAAAADLTGADIFTALLATSPEPIDDELVDEDWRPDRSPTPAEMLQRAAINGARQPIDAVKTLVPALWNLSGAVRALNRPTENSTNALRSATRFNHDIGPQRVWGSTMTPLGDIKAIRSACNGDGDHDVRINDVALAVVGGALRNYLLDKDELPAESLAALAPIPVAPHAPSDATKPSDSDPSRSNFALAAVDLSTDVHDPLERLLHVAAATARAREHGAASARKRSDVPYALRMGLAGAMHRTIVRAVNRTGHSLGVHTIVTNVPGPQDPAYFGGARAVYLSGVAPIADGTGLVNAVGHYGDLMPISFTADREMMPDPDFYTECLDLAVADLLDRVVG